MVACRVFGRHAVAVEAVVAYRVFGRYAKAVVAQQQQHEALPLRAVAYRVFGGYAVV